MPDDLLDPTSRQRSLRYRITCLAACGIYRIDLWRRSRSRHWNRDARPSPSTEPSQPTTTSAR